MSEMRASDLDDCTIQTYFVGPDTLRGGVIVLGGGLVYLFTSGKFLGGEALRLLFLAVSGLILSLGLSVFAAGLWQVIFGRANMKIIKTLLYLMCAFFAIVIFGRVIIRIFE